jgi:hypothetical protein
MTKNSFIKIYVLTAVIMNAMSSDIYRRFSEIRCLHRRGISDDRGQLSLKRRDTSTKLHGFTSQNTAIVEQLMLLTESNRYLF